MSERCVVGAMAGLGLSLVACGQSGGTGGAEAQQARSIPKVAEAPAQTTTPPPKPQPSAGAKKLVGLAKVPFELGWYVDDGTTCENAESATKFEADGFWDVDLVAAYTFHQKLELASLERDESGQYTIMFPQPAGGCPKDEDDCPGGMYIQPKNRTHIGWGINGDAYAHYCPADRVPKALTRQVQ